MTHPGRPRGWRIGVAVLLTAAGVLIGLYGLLAIAANGDAFTSTEYDPAVRNAGLALISVGVLMAVAAALVLRRRGR